MASADSPDDTFSDLPTPPRLPGSGDTGGRRRAPRRRTLSRDSVIDAAMAIVDTQGLDALTMRAVAQALGTGAASLYAHVASKEELVGLLIERVIGEIDLDVGEQPDPKRWTEQLKTMGRAMRRVWSEHGDLARASFARIPLGENALRGSEWMVSVMRAGGLSDRTVGLAGDLFALYVGAVAYEESLESWNGVGTEDMLAFVAQLHDYFASLPVDRFPNLVALAGPLTEGDGDSRFEFGLDVLISGLIAVSARDR